MDGISWIIELEATTSDRDAMLDAVPNVVFRGHLYSADKIIIDRNQQLHIT